MLTLNDGDKVYYSPSDKGFHLASMGGAPDDAVEITEAEWNEILNRQGSEPDVVIGMVGGKPTIVERPFTNEEARRRVQYMAWGHLSDTAVKHGYKNLDDVLGFAEESAVPKFQADGRAFRKWRALVKQAIEEISDNDLGVLRKNPAMLFDRLPKLEKS
jgi:hypothetical protein